jgi:4-diphosphocytidyl-2-C-methyl-D-erythritol kinase
MLTTRAPAKINLTLHVLGRREDGYHALESLVCFAAAGDTVSLVPGPELSLTVDGPQAALAGAEADNLVLKAARLLRERVDGLKVGAFRLTKRLPVAAGLGGGSSDAAGALRLLARLNALPPSDPSLAEAARLTGSDVPVCLDPRARMMRGAGEAVGPALRLPRLFCVLVNPRVPVGTPAVFRALGLVSGERHAGAAHPAIGPNATASELLPLLRVARNDLEAPARALEPVIGDALALVAGTPECRLARMSGSGATVFGLYEDRNAAASAARALRDARPDWWIRATSLR